MHTYSTRRILACLVIGAFYVGNLSAKTVSESNMALPTVNGAALSASVFNQRLKTEVAAGQKDTPQLRSAIVTDLVNRQLLISEAVRRGIDKNSGLQQRLAAIREDLLIETLFQETVSANSLSENDVKAEYERQIRALGPIDQAKEYQLSLIMTGTEDIARKVIGDLQKGGSFEELAASHSIDGSKSNKGKLGWVLPQALNPVVANVMVNLPKGIITANPIETSFGWAIIRVDDIRFYKLPTFEEMQERLSANLLQRKRAELVDKLRSEATIKP